MISKNLSLFLQISLDYFFSLLSFESPHYENIQGKEQIREKVVSNSSWVASGIFSASNYKFVLVFAVRLQVGMWHPRQRQKHRDSLSSLHRFPLIIWKPISAKSSILYFSKYSWIRPFPIYSIFPTYPFLIRVCTRFLPEYSYVPRRWQTSHHPLPHWIWF